MRKWEKVQPAVLEYINTHPNCYVKDIEVKLNLSFYIIDTIIKKNNVTCNVNYGLSPERQKIRDQKIKETLIRRHENGEIQFDYTNEEWRFKVRKGIKEKFLDDSEKCKAVAEKCRRTKIERYGEHYEGITAKIAQSNLEKYGVAFYNNSEKAKQTRLERYGHTGFHNPEKAKQTCLERYGGVGNASSELKAKQHATMMQRYGVTHNFASKDNSINGRSTQKQLYGEHLEEMLRRSKETRMKKYGDPYWSNREKAMQTSLTKYGVPHYMMTREFRLSHSSNVEDQYYNYLMSMYDKNDIIREYKEDRYPFFCDFYIKSKDLFIEFNFIWTHGPHPFDKNNPYDVKLRDKWKSKNSPMYDEAIRIWTDVDIMKYNTACNNNLNYQRIYPDEWEVIKNAII